MALNEYGSGTTLDDMDLKILKLLSEDSKMSYADMGLAVHLTGPAVHGRVKKMEKLGIIKNYSINIDYEKIGMPVTAFVRLQTSKKLSCSDVGKRLVKFSEIEECHSVAGEDDVIIKTRTKTPLDLQHLLDNMRTEGLSEKSISIFVLETHFERGRI
jgi:Lrp/AsnC family leucine-responsive transcriptional regulator